MRLMNSYNRKKGCYEAPIMINFELTEKCNLRCPLCFQDFGCANELPYAVLSDLLEQTAEMGTRSVQFSGGEPLLYKDLCAAVKLSKELGLTTRISTSGKELDIDYAKSLKEAGLDYCHVSLNGSTEEIHGRSRNGYYDTLNAVKVLQETGIECIINWVATHDNVSDLPNMVDLAKSLNVRHMDIIMNKLSNRSEVISECSYEDLLFIKQQYDSNKELMSIENCFIFLRILTQGLSIPLIDKGCLAGRFYMAVDAKGAFMPCPHMKMHSSSVGRISDYWENDETILFLRESFRKGNNNCPTCKFKRYCNPCYAIDNKRLQHLTMFDRQCVCFSEVNNNEGMNANA